MDRDRNLAKEKTNPALENFAGARPLLDIGYTGAIEEFSNSSLGDDESAVSWDKNLLKNSGLKVNFLTPQNLPINIAGSAWPPVINPSKARAKLKRVESDRDVFRGDVQIVIDINRSINRSLRPRTDMDNYGVQEKWALPLSTGASRFGDCEDYALEKRQKLLEAGVPTNAMYLATALSRTAGLHSVLVIALPEGDYVLDNLNQTLTPWNETPYQWVSRQYGRSLENWFKVPLQMSPAAKVSI
ncbi:transglutaminase-like cysteine peptidase [Parvularcula sp. IMCC14364]|uniref:transglutaminase-like cysteine peptidase n=1 Tax=Parvularcula sp. IMCC14364 TaxID=3067902 RepID=UPI002741AA44|nr:transglutaminase-like cysteine peptidase [Parvularcula sp. IMCC14364]